MGLRFCQYDGMWTCSRRFPNERNAPSPSEVARVYHREALRGDWVPASGNRRQGRTAAIRFSLIRKRLLELSIHTQIIKRVCIIRLPNAADQILVFRRVDEVLGVHRLNLVPVGGALAHSGLPRCGIPNFGPSALEGRWATDAIDYKFNILPVKTSALVAHIGENASACECCSWLLS